jgi:hypothetical protein
LICTPSSAEDGRIVGFQHTLDQIKRKQLAIGFRKLAIIFLIKPEVCSLLFYQELFRYAWAHSRRDLV